jgi:hypothetical protein
MTYLSGRLPRATEEASRGLHGTDGRCTLLLDMRVIFVDISAGRLGLSSSEMEARGCPSSICA